MYGSNIYLEKVVPDNFVFTNIQMEIKFGQRYSRSSVGHIYYSINTSRANYMVLRVILFQYFSCSSHVWHEFT